jgi:hypothetical protein
MRLLSLLALLSVGVGVTLWVRANVGRTAPAQGVSNVRDAGPQAMRNPPKAWAAEDQMSDESFPASDPPGTY